MLTTAIPKHRKLDKLSAFALPSVQRTPFVHPPLPMGVISLNFHLQQKHYLITKLSMAMLYALKHMHIYAGIQRLYTRFLSLSGRCLGLCHILQLNAKRTTSHWRQCSWQATVLSHKLNYPATQPPNNYHVTIRNCTDYKVGHHQASNMNEKNDMHMSANKKSLFLRCDINLKLHR